MLTAVLLWIKKTETSYEEIEYQCVITKIDVKYYWTTRKNVQLMPVQSGAFIAPNGSGY